MAKTSDMKKTEAELAEELQKLRRQIARLQKRVGEYKEATAAGGNSIAPGCAWYWQG